MLNPKKLNRLPISSIFFHREKYLLLLMFVFFAVDCFAQGSRIFSAEELRDDFKYLYKTLDATHYDLYANTEKEVFDQEYKKIYDSINDSLSLIQINRLFQPFVALCRLGHCSLEPPFSSYGSYLQNGGTVFPLNVYFKDKQVFVLDNFSSDSSIIPGYEIISINKKPIKDSSFA